MTDQDTLYYAALLHAPLAWIRAHQLPEENLWQGEEGERIRKLVAMPKGHELSGLLRRSLELADGLVQPGKEALQSPFSVVDGAGSKAFVQAQGLTIFQPVLFPTTEEKLPDPKPHLQAFLAEWNSLQDWNKLLPLLEIWFSSLPHHPDRTAVSVYDHARIAAAIAMCLYEHPDGHTASGPLAHLLKGDVSGIQSFIFGIKSKGAAKALKARSMQVHNLAELAVALISQDLGLRPAQILYLGGGNFNLIAPTTLAQALPRLRTDLALHFQEHGLKLYLGAAPMEEQDFKDTTHVWKAIERDLQKARLIDHQVIGYDHLFLPTVPHPPLDNDEWKRKTGRLKEADGFSIGEHYEEPDTSLGGMGLKYGGKDNHACSFNRTESLHQSQGFRFVVNKLPTWTPSLLKQFPDLMLEAEQDDDLDRRIGGIVDFKAFAAFAAHDQASAHLGILKMDVDSLGWIFREGIAPQHRSLARFAGLSRTLKWFFAGYMNTLIRQEKYRNQIYVVFSGGDDLFLLGAWNKVFDFAAHLNQAFSQLTASHPKVTLSAGLLALPPAYPVSRFADKAEDALKAAKGFPGKNRISVFDEVMTWEEWEIATYVKDTLLTLITEHQVSKAVLHKVQRSRHGFDAVQQAAQAGSIRFPKVWRLRHYLREYLHKNTPEETRTLMLEGVVKVYEQLVEQAFSHGSQGVSNPMLFAVAGRWAEFLTRNLKQNPDATPQKISPAEPK